MLARLQRFITLGLLALAAGWASYWLGAQRPWVALIGTLCVLFGHAVILAVEFVLLALVHRDDPTPRASPSQLLRAWWGEVCTAPRVFFWRQPFRATAEQDLLPAAATSPRGVLLVHGFFCNRGLWNPWMRQLRELGVPFVAVNLEPIFGDIGDYADAIEDAMRRLERHTRLPPVVVAHSMGGLAVRAWLADQACGDRVWRVVTIGTPHQGTWLARFGHTRNGRQMRQGNAWLASIAAVSGAERYVCFYSHCDNIVFPPSTAMLPGADNRHLPGVAHVHMVYQDAVFKEVRSCLAAGAAPARREGA